MEYTNRLIAAQQQINLVNFFHFLFFLNFELQTEQEKPHKTKLQLNTIKHKPTKFLFIYSIW